MTHQSTGLDDSSVTETIGYNPDNRPISLADPTGTTTAGYDPAGELTSLTQPTTPSTQETWTYDPAGQLTNIADTQGAATLKSYSLSYDQAGNLTTEVGPGGGTANTTSYTYDPANRLIEVCPAATSCTGATISTGYTYDPVGNRLTTAATAGGTTSTTSYSYDAADQLTQAVPQAGSPVAYSYDANGNQLTAGTQTNTYNLAGQLTSAATASGTVSYSYDPGGNRLTSTVGTDTTSYAWDPNTGNANLPDLVDETLPGGSTRATDWLTPSLPTNINLTTGASATTDYLLTDPQHSVDSLISPTAAVTGNYSYDAFGNLTASSGTDTALNQLRYAAGYLDPTTGQYDNRARTYDPTQGRFTTTDPLPPSISGPYPSAYSYAGNNPLTQWDPTGQYCWLGKNPNGTCRGSREYNWTVKNLDPVSYVLPYYYQEAQDYENGCGYWASLVPGLEGTGVAALQTLAGEVGGVLFKRAAGPLLRAGDGALLGLLEKLGLRSAAESGSALADASSTAFKAADNAGDWAVSAKHLPGAGGRWAKFAEGVDPQSAVQEALRSPDAAFFPNSGGSAGSFIVRTDLGYTVGSNGQTALRVVVSSDGQIITAFPVK